MEDAEPNEEDPAQEPIERIGLVDLLFPLRLERIYADERDYYWSDEWTPEFFVAQARAGFISISFDTGPEVMGQVLLPQIHSANAVLDWEDLHLSKSMRRWMRSKECAEAGYALKVGHDLDAIIAGIERCHGEDNWMNGRYPDLLRAVDAGEWRGFELMPVGLVNKDGVLVGGELGCVTGRVYTSLSGFLDRAYGRAGTLQLFWLAEYLRDAGFAFWNLGQPYMQYKFDLGAKEVPRAKFLKRWRAAAR